MKVVILAGGKGTRLAEETDTVPKPMVAVGGHPIIWHIMKHYAFYGFREFVVPLGYKGDSIKRFFLDYHRITGGVTVELGTGLATFHDADRDDWTVHLVDTGLETQTAGRLKRLRPWLGNESFMLTYGDGVANHDLRALAAFHKNHGRLVTLTAVRPPARFGGLVLEHDSILEFTEKPERPQIGEGWINGGFMVLESGIFDYITDDSVRLEADCMERAAREGQLMAFRHDGFWQCMDTVRDLRHLEEYWQSGAPPWKLWE